MIKKTTLEKLYCEKKLSAAEIATELGTTFPRTLYWIKKHGIPIRSCSERTYVKLNPDGDPFRPKEVLNLRERKLLALALGLYWGEGNRKSRQMLQLANLDPRILQVFMRFLREIARVDERKIRISAQVYYKFDFDAARRYWARMLHIPKKQVRIYRHYDTRSVATEQWSARGIARITVCNIKLKRWVDDQLEAFVRQLEDPQSYKVIVMGQPRAVREEAATYTYA